MVKKILFCLIGFILVAAGLSADEKPAVVSPGSESGISMVDVGCPTFSWTSVSWAKSYKVAVFEFNAYDGVLFYEDARAMANPIIEEEINGTALSWTPPADKGLKDGGAYIWFVAASNTGNPDVWSSGKQFKVELAAGFARSAERLKERLKESGVSETVLEDVFTDMNSDNRQENSNEKSTGASAGTKSLNHPLGNEGDAYNNVYYGNLAGASLKPGGGSNAFFGYAAGYCTDYGVQNTFIGIGSGSSNKTGSNNTFIGCTAGGSNTASDNTFIGNYTGNNNTVGFGNVFLGNRVGYNATGSNLLYIDNSDTSSPLIYGEFNNDLLKINGNLSVTGYLSLDNGATQINSTEINLLDGKTSVSTGSADNDKLVTKGYVDDHSGLTGDYMTNQYICKWDDGNNRLVNSLISENSGNIRINGGLNINSNFLSLDNGATQINSTEMNLLDGKTSISTGSTDNDKLVTKGYVDDHSGLTGNDMTNQYICKWDDENNKLVNSLISENSGKIAINGGLNINSNTLSLDNGVTQISSTEINLLDGKTSVSTGTTDNDKLVTKGYVDENDDVGGGGLTGSDMTDTYICKWDDANTRIIDSLISESPGIVKINGKLGIGTSSPGYPMELETTGENAAFVTERTDGATNFISATATYGQFGTVTNHPARILVNSQWKMILNTDKSLSIASGASCTAGGVWTNASSITLKDNVRPLNTGAAMETLAGLNPVTFTYKTDREEKHVGFIAEQVPELVASKDRKGLSPMDIVAVLTKVVQQQQAVIVEQRQAVAELNRRVAELEKAK